MAIARAVCGFGLTLAKPLPSLLHAQGKLGDTFVIRLYNGSAEDDDSVTTFWQRYLSSPGTCSTCHSGPNLDTVLQVALHQHSQKVSRVEITAYFITLVIGT